MSINLFTKEEIKQLSKSPYVVKVSEKAITYTKEFKEEFSKLYSNGLKPSEIFKKCDINPKIVGNKRISCFASRNRIQTKKGDGFDDKRKGNSGRLRTKELSKDDEIKKLKHEIEFLKQQNDFLKKINFLNKKTIWKKSKKNTK